MKVQFVAKRSNKREKLLSILSLKSLWQNVGPDEGVLLSVFGLLVFGWVMVYSSSAIFAESRYHDQYFFLKKQVIWSLVGMAAFIVTANVPLSVFQKYAKSLYVVTVATLILVLFMGRQIYGAQRWLHFGGLSIQPSELAKVSMVLMIADYLDRRQSRLRDFKKGIIPLLVLVGVLLALIMLEPDLGTPVLMAVVCVALLILGGARWRHLLCMGLLTLPILILAVVKVRYRWERLMVYLNPWSDPQGTGYQLVQSLLALGSGGIFGRGLGESKIKIANLPEAHTDFVFSVLGEELGLVGTTLCAGLFLYLCVKGLQVASQAKTLFSRLVASGISLIIGLQALINMGVACGLFPTKGMPLPFISFGGSSLVIMLFSVGLLANVSRQSKIANLKGED